MKKKNIIRTTQYAQGTIVPPQPVPAAIPNAASAGASNRSGSGSNADTRKKYENCPTGTKIQHHEERMKLLETDREFLALQELYPDQDLDDNALTRKFVKYRKQNVIQDGDMEVIRRYTEPNDSITYGINPPYWIRPATVQGFLRSYRRLRAFAFERPKTQ